MRQCRATEHENSQARWLLLPLLGERAGVRASVFSNLIFGVGGGFWREKHFRLVTSAATALATILESTLPLARILMRLAGRCGLLVVVYGSENHSRPSARGR